jgi:hypothetical protein
MREWLCCHSDVAYQQTFGRYISQQLRYVEKSRSIHVDKSL